MITTSDSKLTSFPKLTELGVKNFFTHDNNFWGPMNLSNGKALQNYKVILDELDISSREFLYLAAEHNDNVRLVTEENLRFYKLFNKSELASDFLTPITLDGDSIVTKVTQIPLVITPADCSVILMTGLDKKDNTRFIILTHVGIFGAILQIYKKNLDLAHIYYDFENSDLEIFFFPGISAQNFTKPKSDFRSYLLEDSEWRDFTFDFGDRFGMDIEGKVSADLESYGVKHITKTGLDTYEEDKNDKLFSYVRTTQIERVKSNFAVGVCLAG